MCELSPIREDTVSLKILDLYRAEEPPRRYLGISQIGHPCARFLWYSYRWAFERESDPRMKRLFETGHLEESRVVAELVAAGMDVRFTGHNQLTIWYPNMDICGHPDGVIYAGVPDAPTIKHLLEIKTHNQRSFDDLSLRGMQASKPMHFAQMQGYMFLTKIKWGLYVAVNKNTSEVYSERIQLEDGAEKLFQRALRITLMTEPPARVVSEANCKYCPARHVCLDGAEVKKGCRTCKHVSINREETICLLSLTAAKVRPDIEQKGCGCHENIVRK